MNFQQLRAVREAARQRFNLTAVADALATSQPGVSRQIRELEDQLGIEIFARAGKRLTGLTPPGETVLPIVERLLLEVDNLKRVGHDFAAHDRGLLSIAATHSQARYALPGRGARLPRRLPERHVQAAPGFAAAGGAHAARR